MYNLASRPHTTLMYSFDYTSLYSYTAIQRDTSDLMYHHPSALTLSKKIAQCFSQFGQGLVAKAISHNLGAARRNKISSEKRAKLRLRRERHLVSRSKKYATYSFVYDVQFRLSSSLPADP